MHLYLATGIAGAVGDDQLTPDEDERLELRHVPLAEALAMVDRGEISDAKSILGIQWLDRLRQAGELAGFVAASPPSPPPAPGAGSAGGIDGGIGAVLGGGSGAGVPGRRPRRPPRPAAARSSRSSTGTPSRSSRSRTPPFSGGSGEA
jgi:hypothetical protein